MSNGWFETVAMAQRRARKQLPKSVSWSIVAGSEQGATLTDSVAAFGELLRGGIDSALLGLGHASIRDLTPDVVVPPGFTCTLGSDRRPANRPP